MHRSMMSRASMVGLVLLVCAGLTACGDDGGTAPPAAGPTVMQDVDEPVDDPADPNAAAGDGGSMAMCVAAISFEDRIYVGVQVPELPVGGEAGQAVTPPCNDTGTTDEQPSAPFPVLEIDGLDPSVAVATEAQGSDGYWIWFTSDKPGSTEPPPAVQTLIDAAS